MSKRTFVDTIPPYSTRPFFVVLTQRKVHGSCADRKFEFRVPGWPSVGWSTMFSRQLGVSPRSAKLDPIVLTVSVFGAGKRIGLPAARGFPGPLESSLSDAECERPRCPFGPKSEHVDSTARCRTPSFQRLIVSLTFASRKFFRAEKVRGLCNKISHFGNVNLFHGPSTNGRSRRAETKPSFLQKRCLSADAARLVS
jgi:hypothetical protein